MEKEILSEVFFGRESSLQLSSLFCDENEGFGFSASETILDSTTASFCSVVSSIIFGTPPQFFSFSSLTFSFVWLYLTTSRDLSEATTSLPSRDT